MIIYGFENTLDQISVSSKDIELQISKYRLEFPKNRRQDIEWEIKFPLFVLPFYKFLTLKNFVPDQETYWKSYVSLNRTYLHSLSFSAEQARALKARLYRTYPSLVRDFHFGKKLSEDNYFDGVFYNEYLDAEYDVDLVVSKSTIRLGLKLFTKTRNSLTAREIKDHKPKKIVNFRCVKLPLDLNNGLSCGNFSLYSDREIKIIKTKLINMTGIPCEISKIIESPSSNGSKQLSFEF